MINIKDNNERFEQHQRILDKIHETYIQKNNAYGNSFDESCDDFGVTAAVVRLSDKFNRLKTLTKNPDIPTGDESVMDTLLDMANYAILTYMWLENQQKKDDKPVTKKLVPINNVKHCKNCKHSGVATCDKPCLTCVNYHNWEPINSCEGCIFDGGTFCNKSPENPCFEHDGYTPKEGK